MVRAGAKPLSRSLKIYQRIAVAFVFVTFFLLLAVLYLSISRATIHVIAEPKIVAADTTVTVTVNTPEEGQLSGVLANQSFTSTKNFLLPAEGATAVEAKAGGTVTLINETSTPQPLVANTRLLSKEGILYRIDTATVVPANGQVDVIAHADQPGLASEVPPTQFTIPGLPQSTQDEIYGVSVEPMTGGVVYRRVLTEKDIDDGLALLSDQLLAQAKTTLSADVDRTMYTGEAYFVDTISRSSDQAPGVETGSFSASITLSVTAVYYRQDEVKAFATSELYKILPEGYEAKSIHTDSLQVAVDDVSVKNGVATMSIYLEGVSAISESSQVLDKERFVGRAPNEVLTLLRASDAVRDVSVSFTPFWLQRVPTLKDHIKIDIELPRE